MTFLVFPLRSSGAWWSPSGLAVGLEVVRLAAGRRRRPCSRCTAWCRRACPSLRAGPASPPARRAPGPPPARWRRPLPSRRARAAPAAGRGSRRHPLVAALGRGRLLLVELLREAVARAERGARREAGEAGRDRLRPCPARRGSAGRCRAASAARSSTVSCSGTRNASALLGAAEAGVAEADRPGVHRPRRSAGSSSWRASPGPCSRACRGSSPGGAPRRRTAGRSGRRRSARAAGSARGSCGRRRTAAGPCRRARAACRASTNWSTVPRKM